MAVGIFSSSTLEPGRDRQNRLWVWATVRFCPLGRAELQGNEGVPTVGERVVQVGSKQNWEVKEARSRMLDWRIGGLPWVWSTIMLGRVAKENWRVRKFWSEIGILEFKGCHEQHWKASPALALCHCRGTVHSIPLGPGQSQVMSVIPASCPI